MPLLDIILSGIWYNYKLPNSQILVINISGQKNALASSNKRQTPSTKKGELQNMQLTFSIIKYCGMNLLNQMRF